jgi:hypothetical protein
MTCQAKTAKGSDCTYKSKEEYNGKNIAIFIYTLLKD